MRPRSRNPIFFSISSVRDAVSLYADLFNTSWSLRITAALDEESQNCNANLTHARARARTHRDISRNHVLQIFSIVNAICSHYKKCGFSADRGL